MLFPLAPEFKDDHVVRVGTGDLQPVGVLGPGEFSPEFQSGKKREDAVLGPLTDRGTHLGKFKNLSDLMAIRTDPFSSNFNYFTHNFKLVHYKTPVSFLRTTMDFRAERGIVKVFLGIGGSEEKG
jgi:hypothetical protein